MKIICIGRNYSDHIIELNNEMPDSMVIFMKPKTALHDIIEPWNIPSFSDDVHYECEIVLKISKKGSQIQLNQANEYYEEISLGIDFTARDLQSKLKDKGLPWERAKSFDGSAIVGDFFPKTELNVSEIQFQMTKNGELAQNGNSKMMIYSFDHIICEVSKYFTLEIGDLIYTGTPAGVARVCSGDVYNGILEGKPVFTLNIQ